MKNETSITKVSPSESFTKIKEKLFSVNSNVPSHDVSSVMEKDEEDIEEIEDIEENRKNNSQVKDILSEKGQSVNDSQVESKNPKLKVYSKTELHNKISMIFRYYSSYSKEEKIFFISQQTLIKIMKRLNLLESNGIKRNELDIILTKLNLNPHSHKLSEKQFFNFIIRLAEKINKDEFKKDPKSAVCQFFYDTFESLSKEIETGKENENEDNNLKSYLQNHTTNSYKLIETIMTIPIYKESIEIVNSVYPAIKEIYIKYFENETNNLKTTKEESLDCLAAFCKDFEIIPYVLNFNMLVLYYQYLSQFKNFNFNIIDSNKELGYNFTLSKFFLTIVHFSHINNFKNHILNSDKTYVSDPDKLLGFLEKLEESKGFQNFERKMNRPHSRNLFLIPTKYLLNKLDDRIESRSHSKILLDNTFSNRNINSNIKLSESLQGVIYSKNKILKEVFSHYCSMGDMNLKSYSMNYTSFSKFVRDCGLIAEMPSHDVRKNSYKKEKFKNIRLKSKFTDILLDKENKLHNNQINKINQDSNKVKEKLSEYDVNIIFSKITAAQSHHVNTNPSDLNKRSFVNSGLSLNFEDNAKINQKFSKFVNFESFLKSLELIGIRLFSNLDTDSAINKFFKEYLENLISKFQQIASKKEEDNTRLNHFDSNQVRNLIFLLKPIFHQIYKGYSDHNEYMNFSFFQEFYKDFNLFPDLMNLLQLKSLFLKLLRNFNKNEEMYNLNSDQNNVTKIKPALGHSQEVINFYYFLESMIMMLGIINFDEEICDEYKFLYILERIDKSSGVDKLQKKMGTTFTSTKDFRLFYSKIREKYPELHKVNKVNTSCSDMFSYIFD